MSTIKLNDSSYLLAEKCQIGDNLRVGEDVVIEAKEIHIGDDVSIGVDPEEDFRYRGGVRIRAEKLSLASGVRIGREVLLRGGSFYFQGNAVLENGNTLKVLRHFSLGQGGHIGKECEIAGVHLELGPQIWVNPYVTIGGGSCFEVHSRLQTGANCHIGKYSFLNTARPIHLGDNVGLGTGTCLFTHGAYLSALEGFPVAYGEIIIGSNTLIFGGVVRPGIRIGSNCVIGVGAVVTTDIPDGCLAAGIPAKVLRKACYPKPLTKGERTAFLTDFLQVFSEIITPRYQRVTFEQGTDWVSVRADLTHIYYHSENQFPAEAGEKTDTIWICYGLPLEIERAMEKTRITVVDLKEKVIRNASWNHILYKLQDQFRRYGIRLSVASRRPVDGKEAESDAAEGLCGNNHLE